MHLTYQQAPRAGEIFNLFVYGIAGTARIEWLIDGNVFHINNCAAPSCDDRRHIRSDSAGKELQIIGKDAGGKTEIRVRIEGKEAPIDVPFRDNITPKAPPNFPAIVNMMKRTPIVRFRTSNNADVKLQNSPTTVTVNGYEKGTIRRDGSFSPARNDISADEIVEILQEFISNPKVALKRYGRKTGKCGICGRTLTNPVSIARGIGPVCAGLV